MTAEIMTILFTQHLGGMWEVPNKDLLNDYAIEIIIYCIGCESKCRI